MATSSVITSADEGPGSSSIQDQFASLCDELLVTTTTNFDMAVSEEVVSTTTEIPPGLRTPARAPPPPPPTQMQPIVRGETRTQPLSHFNSPPRMDNVPLPSVQVTCETEDPNSSLGDMGSPVFEGHMLRNVDSRSTPVIPSYSYMDELTYYDGRQPSVSGYAPASVSHRSVYHQPSSVQPSYYYPPTQLLSPIEGQSPAWHYGTAPNNHVLSSATYSVPQSSSYGGVELPLEYDVYEEVAPMQHTHQPTYHHQPTHHYPHQQHGYDSRGFARQQPSYYYPPPMQQQHSRYPITYRPDRQRYPYAGGGTNFYQPYPPARVRAQPAYYRTSSAVHPAYLQQPGSMPVSDMSRSRVTSGVSLPTHLQTHSQGGMVGTDRRVINDDLVYEQPYPQQPQQQQQLLLQHVGTPSNLSILSASTRKRAHRGVPVVGSKSSEMKEPQLVKVGPNLYRKIYYNNTVVLEKAPQPPKRPYPLIESQHQPKSVLPPVPPPKAATPPPPRVPTPPPPWWQRDWDQLWRIVISNWKDKLERRFLLCTVALVCRDWRQRVDVIAEDLCRTIDLNERQNLGPDIWKGIGKRRPITLNIAWSGVSKAELIDVLERDDRLESLSLAGCHFSAVLALKQCKSSTLTQLDLRWVQGCTDASFKALVTDSEASQLKRLQCLFLSGCEVGDPTARLLANQFRALRELDLSYCTRITNLSLDVLSAAGCQARRSLQSLTLSGCSALSADELFGPIQKLTNLNTLDLRSCGNITKEHCQNFEQACAALGRKLTVLC